MSAIKYIRKFSALLFVLFFTETLVGQTYKDASAPIEKRIEDLLARMTPAEKFRQLFMVPGDPFSDSALYDTGLFGFQVNTQTSSDGAAAQLLSYASGNTAYETALSINKMQKFFIDKTRLGIPIIPFDEALHGLVRNGATAFPQAIGLAASWNTGLMHKVANTIALECKSRGIRQILSPVVNVATDVRWGRTEETYGEDPFLVSEMAVAYVSAFEQQGIITTPKHFVANVGDGGRDSYPIHFNERYMREIHFPPFEASIRRGGARSLMTAYNSYDGVPSTANDWLLNQLLKKEWGFEGFVISDAGATGGANVLHFTASDYTDATVKSIEGGLDVIFQTDIAHESLFNPPFLNNQLKQHAVDDAVRRVLKAKFALGLFDNPYVDPVMAAKNNGTASGRELAKQAALESIVLLKNDDNTLPFGKDIRRIALIGPEIAEARLGGYSGPGNDPVSILHGFSNLVSDSVTIAYTKGCFRNETPFTPIAARFLSHQSGKNRERGLIGKYYNQAGLKGSMAFERTDEKIDFQWTLFSPDPEKLDYGFYSVEWEGFITADTSAILNIGIDGNDGYQLWLDNNLLIDNKTPRGRSLITKAFAFEKGKSVPVRITFSETVGNAWFRLIWDREACATLPEMMDEAVQLAANSDVAVIAVGIEEGEFQDRASLALPGKQAELIKRVAETNTPVVVVLVGGSAVTMENWYQDADAILDVWYAGDAGGDALAEVLFGRYNPAGRLPVTFPRFEGQLPLVYNHKPTGRGDDYVNMSGQPLFPFGFGLSYTSFEYSNLNLSKSTIAAGDSAVLSFSVKNSGMMAGDEVIQLYIRDELASVAQAVLELKGFQRVHLEKGESREFYFTIRPDMLEMLDMQLNKVIEPGDFSLMLGASSRDIRLKTKLTVL